MSEIDETYSAFRTKVFDLRFDRVVLDEKPGDEALALMLEFATSTAVMTLVAVADGMANLSFSTDGDVLEARTSERARRAALEFIDAGKRSHELFERTESFSLPESGNICFYIVQRSGVSVAGSSIESLGTRKRLLYLFELGYELIAAIRECNNEHSEYQTGDV